MINVEISDIGQLPEVARNLLETFSEERFFAFFGKMGVGKTTLIKELCAALGVEDNVCSPTFAIVNEYKIVRDRSGANDFIEGEPVYHFDFYRIKRLEEAYDIGFDDYIDSGNLCFIEWPELIEELLPEDATRVEIEETDNGSRIVRF